MNIKESKELFMKRMTNNGCSPLTLKIYGPAIDEFIAHTGVSELSDITGEVLLAYREHVAGMNVSPKTKNLKIIPVRGLIRCLAKEHIAYLPEAPLSTFRNKNGKKPFDLISREELKKYLEYKENQRNDLLVNLLYETGLRIAELLALNVSDMKQEFEIQGKGGRERKIFIGPKVWQMVVDYIGDRKDGPLFLSNQGKRISKVWVETIVRERGERLGISKKITPHVLRHLYATHLYEDGVDLNILKEMLGHASLNTTQVYAHVSVDRMRAAHEKVFGDKKAEV